MTLEIIEETLFCVIEEGNTVCLMGRAVCGQQKYRCRGRCRSGYYTSPHHVKIIRKSQKNNKR